MWTMTGLILDALGVALVGFIIPKLSPIRLKPISRSGSRVTAVLTDEPPDRVAQLERFGWSLILAGFVLQIIGQT